VGLLRYMSGIPHSVPWLKYSKNFTFSMALYALPIFILECKRSRLWPKLKHSFVVHWLTWNWSGL